MNLNNVELNKMKHLRVKLLTVFVVTSISLVIPSLASGKNEEANKQGDSPQRLCKGQAIGFKIKNGSFTDLLHSSSSGKFLLNNLGPGRIIVQYTDSGQIFPKLFKNKKGLLLAGAGDSEVEAGSPITFSLSTRGARINATGGEVYGFYQQLE